MKKYWLLLKNQVSLITNYRIDLFGRWIVSLFEISVYYSLWRLTSQGNKVIERQIFIYFVLTYGILNNLQSSKTARWMANDILSGNAAKYLIKPIALPLTMVIRSIPAILSRIVTPALLITLGTFLLPNYFAPQSVSSLLFAVITALLGLIFWNQVMILIGTIAFWGTEIESLTIAFGLSMNLIKGAYIPAFLFPNTVKQIIRLTPINYLVALPIEIYQNQVSLNFLIKNWLIIIFWIALFVLIINWFYRKALKHYQAYGG